MLHRSLVLDIDRCSATRPGEPRLSGDPPRRRGRPRRRGLAVCAALLGGVMFLGATDLPAQVSGTGGPINGGGTVVVPGGPVPIGGTPFVRGDANVDGNLNIADGIQVLAFLFQSDAIPCEAAADVNDDNLVNIADAIALFFYLFQAGPSPTAPFPDCGLDPTAPQLTSCATFDLCATGTDRATAAHVLRRIAYGPTPADLAMVESIGAEAYILQQLEPDLIAENPVIDTKLATIPITVDWWRYPSHVAIRGRYSTRQLQEQLTDFWSNHFHTYYWTFRAWVIGLDGGGTFNGTTSLVPAMVQEAIEDELFRQNCLGSFETLLTLSATSPTMLVYLDNVSNVVGNPNENYAREILELHTVGVDGGYSQADVEQLARCFTGWSVHKVLPADYGDPFAPSVPNSDPAGIWSFKFEPSLHDYGPKNLFASMGIPLSIPARPAGSPDGVLDGIEVIQHLSASSLTAEYVSSKLIGKFVTDGEPPPALLANCIASWLASSGDMRSVLETILLSPEFLGTEYRFDKVKTPMETLVSTIRMLDGESVNGNQERIYLGSLQHQPLMCGTPDGYPERGDDWIGTSKLVDTIHFNQLIVGGSSQLTYDPRPIQQAAGIDESDPNAVVGFWLDLMFPDATNATDVQLALDFLSTDDLLDPTPLDPLSGDYDLRLRKFLVFLRSWPQAMKQ